MSKKNQKVAGGEKKSSLVVLLVMLVALGACALAGYSFYEIKNIKTTVASNSQNALDATSAEYAAPIYVPLETFTVSLEPSNGESDHVLYIGLTIQVRDNNSKALLEKFLPEVRSRLLMLFSQQTAAELSMDEGKEKLIDKIKTVVNTPLADHQSVIVTDVLFNAFILR